MALSNKDITIDAVEFLISQGVNLREKDEDGFTPLYLLLSTMYTHSIRSRSLQLILSTFEKMGVSLDQAIQEAAATKSARATLMIRSIQRNDFITVSM